MILQLKVLRNLRRLASFLSQNKWRLSDYLLGKDDNRADRLAELIESLRIYSDLANAMLVQTRNIRRRRPSCDQEGHWRPCSFGESLGWPPIQEAIR